MQRQTAAGGGSGRRRWRRAATPRINDTLGAIRELLGGQPEAWGVAGSRVPNARLCSCRHRQPGADQLGRSAHAVAPAAQQSPQLQHVCRDWKHSLYAQTYANHAQYAHCDVIFNEPSPTVVDEGSAKPSGLLWRPCTAQTPCQNLRSTCHPRQAPSTRDPASASAASATTSGERRRRRRRRACAAGLPLQLAALHRHCEGAAQPRL